MSNVYRFDAYGLLGVVCLVAIVLALGVGLLLAWHLLRILDRNLRDRRRRPAQRCDNTDDGLTAILDIVRDADESTQELPPVHPVYAGRRRRENRLSDSYINGEDFR